MQEFVEQGNTINPKLQEILDRMASDTGQASPATGQQYGQDIPTVTSEDLQNAPSQNEPGEPLSAYPPSQKQPDNRKPSWMTNEQWSEHKDEYLATYQERPTPQGSEAPKRGFSLPSFNSPAGVGNQDKLQHLADNLDNWQPAQIDPNLKAAVDQVAREIETAKQNRTTLSGSNASPWGLTRHISGDVLSDPKEVKQIEADNRNIDYANQLLRQTRNEIRRAEQPTYAGAVYRSMRNPITEDFISMGYNEVARQATIADLAQKWETRESLSPSEKTLIKAVAAHMEAQVTLDKSIVEEAAEGVIQTIPFLAWFALTKTPSDATYKAAAGFLSQYVKHPLLLKSLKAAAFAGAHGARSTINPETFSYFFGKETGQITLPKDMFTGETLPILDEEGNIRLDYQKEDQPTLLLAAKALAMGAADPIFNSTGKYWQMGARNIGKYLAANPTKAKFVPKAIINFLGKPGTALDEAVGWHGYVWEVWEELQVAVVQQGLVEGNWKFFVSPRELSVLMLTIAGMQGGMAGLNKSMQFYAEGNERRHQGHIINAMGKASNDVRVLFSDQPQLQKDLENIRTGMLQGQGDVEAAFADQVEALFNLIETHEQLSDPVRAQAAMNYLLAAASYDSMVAAQNTEKQTQAEQTLQQEKDQLRNYLAQITHTDGTIKEVTLETDGDYQQHFIVEGDPRQEGALLVDGQAVTLKRVFKEKWQKKRGSAQTEFTGHETEYFWNDVPLTQKEYMEKVAEIVPEETFKLVTNPNYFPNMKWQVQREILFELAGEVSFTDLAKGNREFESLLKEIQGKTFEEYRKQIAANKRRIKEQLDQIQPRIDEVKRSKPAPENWKDLEKELKEVNQDIEKTEAAITDKNKAYEGEYEKRNRLLDKLQQARRQMREIVEKSQQEQRENLSIAKASLTDTGLKIRRLDGLVAQQQEDKKNTLGIIASEHALLADWREKWNQEAARQLSFDQDAFSCPTCHRPLDLNDIDKRQQDMTSEFNTKKSNTLAEISKAGKGLKATIATWQQKVTDLDQQIAKGVNELEAYQQMFATISDRIEKAEKEAQGAIPESHRQAQATVEQLEKQYAEPIQVADTENLRHAKAQLALKRDDLTKTLALKIAIDKANDRISELEKQEQTMAQGIADLEQTEYIMGQFTRLYTDEVEKRVNEKFAMVKFRLFDTQVNGQEVPTCQATVDGVPYSGLNSAARINAGLDIVNALSQHHGILAPVWIDNAETILHPIKVHSQLIRLVVSENHPELSIVTN